MPPGMRVVLAPASFGALGPALAADAMAAGVRQVAPATDLIGCPISDGGYGMADAVRAARGGDVLTAPGLSGRVLLAGDTAYVEAGSSGSRGWAAASADAGTDSTYDLGLLIRRALDAPVRRIVIGLARDDTFDGGAGLLQALGAVLHGPTGPLSPGVSGAELLQVQSVDLSGLEGRLDGVLFAAAAPPVELLGLSGAAVRYGSTRPHVDVQLLDRALGHWAGILAAALPVAAAAARTATGAGAAGGAGLALAAFGGTLTPGAELLATEIGLAERVESAGLVLTGEPTYGWSSLRPPAPVAVVAGTAASCAVPCVVLAERVLAGRRETAVAGVDATYDLAPAELLASPAAGGAAGAAAGDVVAEDLAGRLRAAAARATRDWIR